MSIHAPRNPWPRMNPVGLVGLLFLIGSLAPTARVAEAQETPAATGEKPNVLLILTEDQGGHLSLLNTPGLDTPHMDRIASRGIYFNRAYVSYPVCSPSKASIYTGTYAHTNGLINNTQNFFVPADELTPAQKNNKIYQRVSIDKRLPTLTQVLRHNGYHTAVSGKLHVSPNDKFPYDEWFRENETDRTAEMIRNAGAAGKPWFFFANIQAPHRPFRNSDQVKIGVDPAEVELPPFLPDTPVARKDWAEYLDYVQVADAQVGDVLAAVEQAGELNNTLIILMGDHGPAYHRGKMTLYQFGLHVPFAVAGPGIDGGRQTDAMLSGVDVMPTLLELLGIAVPGKPQGQSLAGVVRGGEGAGGREHVFAEIMHRGQVTDDGMQERSVFDGRFKLIYRENVDQPRDVNTDLKYWVFTTPQGQKFPWHNRVYDEIVEHKNDFPMQYELLTRIDPQTYGVTLPTFELYDTETDPWELDNLAEDAEHAGELSRLQDVLRGWAVETRDRYIDPQRIE